MPKHTPIVSMPSEKFKKVPQRVSTTVSKLCTVVCMHSVKTANTSEIPGTFHTTVFSKRTVVFITQSIHTKWPVRFHTPMSSKHTVVCIIQSNSHYYDHWDSTRPCVYCTRPCVIHRLTNLVLNPPFTNCQPFQLFSSSTTQTTLSSQTSLSPQTFIKTTQICSRFAYVHDFVMQILVFVDL